MSRDDVCQVVCDLPQAVYSPIELHAGNAEKNGRTFCNELSRKRFTTCLLHDSSLHSFWIAGP